MHIFILASYAPSLLVFRGPLIAMLRTMGHTVSVGAPDIAPDVRAALLDMGVSVYETTLERRGTSLASDIAYYRLLRDLFGAVKPDMLLSYTIKPNIWGAFAAKALNIPSYALVSGLGYAFTDTGVAPSWGQRLMRLAARGLYRASTRQNRGVIFQNPDDRADFIAAGALADPAKAHIVNGSGVDMAHYARVPLASAPVVLMVSRLLGAKGVREYAAAALSLRQSHPTARFLLVGPYDEGADSVSADEVAQWTAQGLEYLGATTDVRPFIAQARLYVLPSYREGTPRSVLEAMAMGRPVITSDAPGCRETVEPGVNGLLVPVRDPQALARAIAHLLDNPDAAAAMGEAGYRLVQRKYDVRLVNRAILEIMGLASPPTA